MPPLNPKCAVLLLIWLFGCSGGSAPSSSLKNTLPKITLNQVETLFAELDVGHQQMGQDEPSEIKILQAQYSSYEATILVKVTNVARDEKENARKLRLDYRWTGEAWELRGLTNLTLIEKRSAKRS